MADGAIDSISIEIGASASEAVKEITKLSSALKSLKKEQQSTASAKTSGMFKGMTADSVAAMNKIDLMRKKLSALKNDLSQKMTLGKIDDKGIANAALQIKNLQDRIGKTVLAEAKQSEKTEVNEQSATVPIKFDGSSALLSDMKQISKELLSNIKPAMQSFTNMLKTAIGYAGKLSKAFVGITGKGLRTVFNPSAFKVVENSFGRIQKIISSFGRIAFYRLIRSAIKYVTDALKEGATNAYWFAREFGNATSYIADAYDQLSSSNFKMSNQLGAGWATLIATIQPIIQRLIDLVTRAAAAITQLFSILGGKGTYLKATDYNKQWADSAQGAAKAAEEWKNQLMGFDEINRLEEPSDGGGGGGSNLPDYGNMFEEAEVSDFFKQIKEMIDSGQWKELGQMLGKRVNDAINSIDFAGAGKKLGYALYGVIETAYSFLSTVDFKNIGLKLADFLNNTGNMINFETLGRLKVRLKTALWDVLYGMIIGIDWGMVARSLSDYFIGAFNELSEWIQTIDPEQITASIEDFLANIKYEELAKSFFTLFGVALGAAAKLLGDFFGDAIDKVKEYFRKKTEEMGGDAWEGFKKGMSDAWKGITGWVKQNIVDPLVNGIKTILGIHSPSTVFEDIGMNVIAGFKEGIEKKWNEFTSWIQGKWNDFKSWWQGLSAGSFHINVPRLVVDWEPLGDNSVLRALFGFTAIPHLSIGWDAYAQGGFPEDGLFLANHSELVGQFSNGKTAVANNEQITEGIAKATYEAFMTAFAQTGGSKGNDQPVNIYLDGKLIAKSTTKYQNQYARVAGI